MQDTRVSCQNLVQLQPPAGRGKMKVSVATGRIGPSSVCQHKQKHLLVGQTFSFTTLDELISFGSLILDNLAVFMEFDLSKDETTVRR